MSQQTAQKHKIKKYLNLLKNAQNPAFIKLVVQNLSAELGPSHSVSKPDKILKIIHFLNFNVLKCEDNVIRTRDFARMKITEGLAPLIVSKLESTTNFSKIVQQIIHGLNSGSQKWQKKVNLYTSIIFDLRERDTLGFKSLTIQDIIQNSDSKNGKTRMTQLMSGCRALRRNDDSSAGNDANDLTKAQLFEELDNTFGVFRLSDTIDKKFLEECLAPVSFQNQSPENTKMPLKQFLDEIEGPEIINIDINKRQKTAECPESKPAFVILSPILSLLLSYTENLTNESWEVRQAAVCGLTAILEQISKMQIQSLNYAIIQQKAVEEDKIHFELKDYRQIDILKLYQNILPRAMIMMLKDQFSDYEDVNVAFPVRAQGKKLITEICNWSNSILKSEIDLLVHNLPQLLVACENTWQEKLSFFMIVKGLISNGQNNHVFEIFGRELLIECIPRVEDSVRIVVCELLKEYLDRYFKESENNKKSYIDRILTNLTQTLKSTDEIEGSVIFVFNLINEILNSQHFDAFKSQFRFSTEIFCPFNFHRVVSVRTTFNILIQKFLNLNHFNSTDLFSFHSLTVQSLIMESDEQLKEVLYKNLKLIVQQLSLNKDEYVTYLRTNLLLPQRFQSWIYQFEITREHFKSFLIFESPCFDSIEGDYFQLIYEPILDSEKKDFYHQKLESCVKILSIIGSQGNLHDYISQFLKMHNFGPGIIGTADVQELLVYEQYQQLQAVTQPSPLAVIQPLFLNQVRISSQLPDHIGNFGQDRLVEWTTLVNSVSSRSRGNPEISHHLTQALNFLYSDISSSRICLDQALSIIYQRPNLSSGFTIQIEKMKNGFEDLIDAHQLTLDRYKSLAINWHLTGYQLGNHGIHSKLNEIIHPLWSHLKLEQEVFFQNVFARIVVERLLPALKQAKKMKAVNSIIQLVLGSLAKSSNPQCQIEVRGACQIVALWIEKDAEQIFEVEGTDVIKKYVEQISINQDYTNTVFQIVQLLNKQTEKTRKVLNIPLLYNIADNLLILFGDAQPLVFLPELVSNLFDLSSISSSADQKDLQLRICYHLHSSLDAKSESSFLTLKLLLEKCLTKSTDIIQYLALFLLPVIKSVHHSKHIFSNKDEQMIMRILSNLIQLLPLCLNNGQSNELIKSELGVKIQEGLEFMNVFTQNTSQIKDKSSFPIEIYPQTELREYQKTGIEWMSKLGRYGLNCCLCDDMGLGKTIQSLTVVINESLYKQRKDGFRPVSLVICPNTLTYQWHKEIDKFFSHSKIRSAVYSSANVNEVLHLIQNREIDIVITSYEKARGDINRLSQIPFFFLVLDEGHRIKNAKSKVTQSVKALNAERKLVLTGTPLQNRVSELWSIFDFLMPNFLEEQKVFNQKYNQFLSSNLSKLSEKLEDTQNFIDALKSLKKRIAPFILRRTKTEVLKDLPPKVIQDYDCEMPQIQSLIHSYIDKVYPIQQVTQGTDQSKEAGPDNVKTASRGSQILSNLILHRKVCNHPMLVRDQLSTELRTQLDAQMKGKIRHSQVIDSSGKMIGLVDLLRQSEIITDESGEDEQGQTKPKGKKAEEDTQFQGLLGLPEDNDDDSQKNSQPQPENTPHRALIFCQMQNYLSMIIENVLIPFGIKFTTLESAHSGQQRFERVEEFNNDQSIRIMIMTTAVGGLGLNLTGADTVIFMEHDWNPMKDLQAIDRAHRIGQKRTVNVYRLVLRETLEEQIMGLQRFKKQLASNLIQSQPELSMKTAEMMPMHDLLASFEEHTVFKATTEEADQVDDAFEQAIAQSGIKGIKDISGGDHKNKKK